MDAAGSSRQQKRMRMSRFFALEPHPEEAEARREGIEKMIEAGLLDLVLQYLQIDDMVKLARSCRFFKDIVKRVFTKRCIKWLGLYIDDIRSFVILMHALDTQLSGEAVTAMLLNISKFSDSGELGMCFRTSIEAAAMKRYLIEREGYVHDDESTSEWTMDLSRWRKTSKKKGLSREEEALDIPVMRLVHRKKPYIQLYHFDNNVLLWKASHIPSPDTSWLVKDNSLTCLANSMTTKALTMYYPYSLSRKTTRHIRPDEVRFDETATQRAQELVDRYGFQLLPGKQRSYLSHGHELKYASITIDLLSAIGP